MTNRNSYLLRTYGITQKDFEDILESQGNICPICLRRPEEVGRQFVVEHNHVTREIRAVTCSYCNLRIISRHRDHEIIKRLAHYLENAHTGFFVPKKKPKKRKKIKDIL